MINWWREDLYIDWLEVTFIVIVVTILPECAIINYVNKKEKDERKKA